MADQSKEGFLTYTYLLLYIALSSGQIFFNKVSLNKFMYSLSNCVFPLVIDLVFRGILAQFLKEVVCFGFLSNCCLVSSVATIGGLVEFEDSASN